MTAGRAAWWGAVSVALLGFASPFVLVGTCAQVQESFPPECGQPMIASVWPWAMAVIGAPIGAILGLVSPLGRRR